MMKKYNDLEYIWNFRQSAYPNCRRNIGDVMKELALA
jgi:hypothetical protein